MTTYLDDLAEEIRSEVPQGKLPRGDTAALFRVYAVLLLAKGAGVNAADVHNAWVAWATDHVPDHEALVPFEALSPAVASEDQPFVHAIHRVQLMRGVLGTRTPLDQHLFPTGQPKDEKDIARLFELYKLMVASSEALVARRQGVNSFFLTINGALLTAAGLILTNSPGHRLKAAGLFVLTFTGCLLASAWRSLLLSFGQLNTGKFAVINRIEQLFPAAIYLAEWKALGEGRQPKKYRTFSSREVWTPWAFIGLYTIASVVELAVILRFWEPG